VPGLTDVTTESAIYSVIYVPVRHDTLSYSAASRVVDIIIIIITINVVITKNVADRLMLRKILSCLPKHEQERRQTNTPENIRFPV